MKRTLRAGILSAALFAAAADTRAQSNVYSVSAVSYPNISISPEAIPHDQHEVYVGFTSNRYGLEEYWQNSSYRVQFVHVQQASSAADETSVGSLLAIFSFRPLGLWISRKLAMLIGTLTVGGLLLAASRYGKRNQKKFSG